MSGSAVKGFIRGVGHVAGRVGVAAAIVALVASSAFAAEMNWVFLRDSAPPGEPPARVNAVSWRAQDGSAYMFGAHESNDMWRYTPDSNEWFIAKPGQETSYGACGVASPMNAPSPRSGSSSWTGPNGKLYLFGGYGQPASCPQGFGNDLWSYDVGTNEWTWLKGSSSPNQVGIYGTQGVAAPENTPGARDQAVSWTGADGCLYLFGGTGFADADSGVLNDLWRYDINTNQWVWLKGSSSENQTSVRGTQGVPAPENMPGSRAGAVSWIGSDGALYLFGGYWGSKTYANWSSLSELWRYDVQTNQWTWLKGSGDAVPAVYGTQGVATDGNSPGARSDSVSWTGSDGSLYLMGGYAVSGLHGRLNDLWRYDVGTNQWMWLKGGNSSNCFGAYGTRGVAVDGNTPGARQGAVSWKGSDGLLYLFAGEGLGADGYTGFLNDLWRYDVGTNQWTWLKGSRSVKQYGVYGIQGLAAPGNTPGARSDIASWTGPDGALYLFGGQGYGTSGPGSLNDLWRYDVGTSLWTWLKGSVSTKQSGIYGTQGLPALTNTPGAREGAVSWTGQDDTLYLFGGCGYGTSGSYGYLNDLWRYDVGTNQWTWLKGSDSTDRLGVYGTQGVGAPEYTPGARYGAVVWSGADGSVYLFGGTGYGSAGASGLLNDLWRYDARTNQWTWLKGSSSTEQSGVYGIQSVASPDSAPGARQAATSFGRSGRSLYLFGGYGHAASGLGGRLNDLWRYDVDTNRWTWVKGSSATAQYGVYGTQGVAAPDNTPGARRPTASFTGSDGALYLFGGDGDPGSGYDLNDLWCYDIGRGQWTWLKGSRSCNQYGVYGTCGVASQGNTPAAREGGAVSWVGTDGALYLFGGCAGATGPLGYLGDLWRLVPRRSDLAVSVSAKSDALIGDDISYAIQVHNNGPDTARDVTLSTSAPVELLFIDAFASTGTVTQGSDGNVMAQLGTLAGDESATVAVRLLARSAGTFDFEAFAGCVDDLNTSNNLAVASTQVSVGRGPDLQASWSGVRMTHRRSSAGTVWHIRGTLTVANTGERITRRSTIQVFLNDTPSLPPGLTPQASFSLDPIKMKRSPSRTFKVDLPVTVSFTGKYLIAVVDSGNTLVEANEFNNVCVFGPLR